MFLLAGIKLNCCIPVLIFLEHELSTAPSVQQYSPNKAICDGIATQENTLLIHKEENSIKVSKKAAYSVNKCKCTICSYWPSFFTLKFLAIALIFATSFVGNMGALQVLPALAEQLGYSRKMGEYIVTGFGVCQLSFAIIFGLIGDLSCVNRPLVVVVSNILGGVLVYILLAFPTYWSLMLVSLCGAGLVDAPWAFATSMLDDAVSSDLPMAMAILMAFGGVASFAGPALSGNLIICLFAIQSFKIYVISKLINFATFSIN